MVNLCGILSSSHDTSRNNSPQHFSGIWGCEKIPGQGIQSEQTVYLFSEPVYILTTCYRSACSLSVYSIANTEKTNRSHTSTIESTPNMDDISTPRRNLAATK